MQKTWKMTETLAHGYTSESTQWELPNEFPSYCQKYYRCRQQFLEDLLGINPSNALGYFHPKHTEHKNLSKPSKPHHTGTHLKALAEYFQMSTHLPGFRWFFRVFALFCFGRIIATTSIRVKHWWVIVFEAICHMGSFIDLYVLIKHFLLDSSLFLSFSRLKLSLSFLVLGFSALVFY